MTTGQTISILFQLTALTIQVWLMMHSHYQQKYIDKLRKLYSQD